ncbi:MAG TPA: molybdopterin-guanine dinucleotide biosynthesis protein B [Casimicrobiaceae bacterium]|nr:molybdopterin-guanine dinucleotide biosynthesis protein B [Casimicrobiaceae bacterium]
MQVFGFAGWSGSGKTTLIEALIPRLRAMGLTVSLIKHAHHEFDIDLPGKDSYRHRVAGCQEVLVSSATRWAQMHELRGAPELSLAQALARLSPCDLALVEGFKAAAIPKLEVYRESVGKPLLHPGDRHIVAIATDRPLASPLRRFDIGDVEAIAAFIAARREAAPEPPSGGGRRKGAA